jgi:hypothetical protein
MTSIDLSPASLDLKGIRAGDRNLLEITLTSAGAPMDLTGLTITAQARKKPNDDTAVLDAMVDVTDAVAGKLSLRWPGEDVRTFMAGQASFNGVWDMQVQSAEDDPYTVVAGAFGAVMDVTR